MAYFPMASNCSIRQSLSTKMHREINYTELTSQRDFIEETHSPSDHFKSSSNKTHTNNNVYLETDGIEGTLF